MKYASPTAMLKDFKAILKEAAKVWGKPENTISQGQFLFVSNGRIGSTLLAKFGGYGTVREWAAPSKDKNKYQQQLACLERILKNARA